MKKKLLFGLFFICLLCIFFLILCIQVKRSRQQDFFELPIEAESQEMPEEQPTLSASQANTKKVENVKKTSGYYAKNRNGCICIFKEDGNTLFFESDILYDDLPVNVRSEMDGEGKFFSSELEVYYFLESYSS